MNGQLKKFPTRAEAFEYVGIRDKGPDPLEALRAKAPMYNTFKDAVDDHGEDEEGLEEEEEWS